MWKFAGRLAVVATLAFAPLTIITTTTPAVGSAAPPNCPAGEYWEPTSSACQPVGVGPQPLDCQAGEYWEPTRNVCRPLGVGPQPLDCQAGEYWEPFGNVCRPLGVWP